MLRLIVEFTFRCFVSVPGQYMLLSCVLLADRYSAGTGRQLENLLAELQMLALLLEHTVSSL